MIKVKDKARYEVLNNGTINVCLIVVAVETGKEVHRWRRSYSPGTDLSLPDRIQTPFGDIDNPEMPQNVVDAADREWTPEAIKTWKEKQETN